MQLIDVSPHEAQGHYLVQPILIENSVIRKGTKLNTQHIKMLTNANFKSISIAKLEHDEINEHDAAQKIATYLPKYFKINLMVGGRINLHVQDNGLFEANIEAINQFNEISPEVTLATLQSDIKVLSGEKIATFKIIPLAIKKTVLEQICQFLSTFNLFQILLFQSVNVTLFSTRLPTLKEQILDKTTRILNVKLKDTKNCINQEIRLEHDSEALAAQLLKALKDKQNTSALFVINSASSVISENDVVPVAIKKAGGEIIRIGMPVEPGNLLILAKIQNIMIIGLPSCARNTLPNGFDLILNQVLVGKAISSVKMAHMGVGGLLNRYHEQRETQIDMHAKPIHVAAIVLAAGQSSRLNDLMQHKLLTQIKGETLIHKTVSAVVQSKCAQIKVVTGYRHKEIEAQLIDFSSNFAVETIYNPDYAQGMASSLITGVKALNNDTSGIMIVLGDMPAITTDMINTLISTFTAYQGSAIIRATSQGKRGNPVIVPYHMKEQLLQLQGDVGARALIENTSLDIVDVDIGEAAHIDLDTKEAIENYKNKIQ